MGNLSLQYFYSDTGGRQLPLWRGWWEGRFSFQLVHLYQTPALGGPTDTSYWRVTCHSGCQGRANQNEAEGRLGGSFHITWPNPSLSLKFEAWRCGLDWARVSQIARGYLGLQHWSPNPRIMSIRTTAQDPTVFLAFCGILLWCLPTCPPPFPLRLSFWRLPLPPEQFCTSAWEAV